MALKVMAKVRKRRKSLEFVLPEVLRKLHEKKESRISHASFLTKLLVSFPIPNILASKRQSSLLSQHPLQNKLQTSPEPSRVESIIPVDVTVDTVNIEAVKIEDIEKVEDSSLLFSLFQSQRELSRVSSTVYMSGGSMTKLKAHESLAEITTQPQTNSDDTVKIEAVKIEDIEKVEDSSLLFSLFQSQRELSRVSSTVSAYVSGGSVTILKAQESLVKKTTQRQTNNDDTVNIEAVKFEDIVKDRDSLLSNAVDSGAKLQIAHSDSIQGHLRGKTDPEEYLWYTEMMRYMKTFYNK